jgi:hypothetical protein
MGVILGGLVLMDLAFEAIGMFWDVFLSFGCVVDF